MVRSAFLNNNGKLDKSNQMTKEEIISLLEKGATYNNYYYCSNPDDELKTEYYIKDNVVTCYVGSKLESWTNYNTGEEIRIWGDKATISNNAKLPEDSQYGFDYSLISKEEIYGLNYKYIGEKALMNSNVIIVEESNTNATTKFVINKQTGLILERIDLSKFFSITFLKIECNRNVKTDIVTNKDIEKPDLSNYKILNYNS